DVAVNIDLEQHARMIRWTPCRCRRHPVKFESRKIQLVDKRLNDPDLVLLRDEVVQILRKQNALSPILTLDKALHQEPRINHQDSNPINVFTQPRPKGDLQVRRDERSESERKRSSREDVGATQSGRSLTAGQIEGAFHNKLY